MKAGSQIDELTATAGDWQFNLALIAAYRCNYD
jgi:hypothetical protein